jgi:transposase-like protein
MDHGKPRDPRKEQHWRRVIQLSKNSELTVRAFCARHHITQPSFYAWRRELQHLDDAIVALDVRLSDEEIKQLEAQYRPHPVRGHQVISRRRDQWPT